MGKFARQPCGVGIHRRLQVAERDHVVCLLRLIERLPIISELLDHGGDLEALRCRLRAIHDNHVELAKMATAFLSPTTEGQAHEGETEQHH